MKNPNAANKVMDWLINNQLAMDREWMKDIEGGVRWWAYRHAQDIQVSREWEDEELGQAHTIRILTDVSRLPAAKDEVLEYLNTGFGPRTSMAAPVILDGQLRLCSSARVHEGNWEWMMRWLSIAAILQLHEAVLLAGELEKLGCTSLTSGHPDNGMRPWPDEMQNIVEPVIKRNGGNFAPERYSAEMLLEDVRKYFYNFPTLAVSTGEGSFTVRFPFGRESSSLFRGEAQYHREDYLHGLKLSQIFPVKMGSPEEGYKLALELNKAQVYEGDVGYGYGSFYYRDDVMVFDTFLPNVGCTEDMLANFYYNAAERALDMSLRFTGCDFSETELKPGEVKI